MQDEKLGASRSLVDGEWTWPLHGLRHESEGGTSGWYVWSGDLSEDPDFFLPWHSCLGTRWLRRPGCDCGYYLDLQVSQREFRSVKEFTDLPGQVD